MIGNIYRNKKGTYAIVDEDNNVIEEFRLFYTAESKLSALSKDYFDKKLKIIKVEK